MIIAPRILTHPRTEESADRDCATVRRDMRSALRKLAGPFFIGAGALHFVRPEPYRAIMPPYVPAPDVMVALSGVAEAAGGVGLLVPRARRWSAWWLVATLIAIFPANLHMALHPERYARHVPGGRVGLWLRLPFQLVFIAWVLGAGKQPEPEP
jgi:uncharacterized membrane protein